MTYNVFGGTLSLTQSIFVESADVIDLVCSLVLSTLAAVLSMALSLCPVCCWLNVAVILGDWNMFRRVDVSIHNANSAVCVITVGR